MSDQRNLDIHFILGVFLKYCWLILFTSVLIGAVTFVFNRFFVQKIYRATAKVCIMPNSMVSSSDRESRLSQTSTNLGTGYQEMLVLNYLIYDINDWVASRNLNERMVERVRENKLIPADIDYSKISHISAETRDKLEKIRPKDLAQASRIGGVKPVDISILMILMFSC